MQISLLEVNAGSFDIRLVSTEIIDLFGNSDCGNAIERLFELLNAESNQEKLKTLLLGTTKTESCQKLHRVPEIAQRICNRYQIHMEIAKPRPRWNSISIQLSNAKSN